jgi:CHAT domain-containing protein
MSSTLATQLLEASTADEFVQRHRSRLLEGGMAELKDEVDRLVACDLKQAEHLARAARDVGRLLGDAPSGGFGDAALAMVCSWNGQYREAELLYNSAITALSRHRRRVEAAALERQLVTVLLRLGRAREALQASRRARRGLRGEPLLLAQLDVNVGNVAYYLQGRYRTALRYYDRARAAFAVLADQRALAFTDFNRANALSELDQPHAALQLYKAAEQSLRDLGLDRAAEQVSFTAAYTEARLGRISDALQRYYRARERAAELGDFVHAALASLYLAELHLRLNDLDEAAALVTAARAELETLDYQKELARALTVEARAASRRCEHSSAVERLRQAEAIYTELGLHVLAATAALQRARSTLELGDAVSARALATECAATFRRLGLQAPRTRARLLEAECALAAGDTTQASRIASACRRSVTNDPWLAYRAAGVFGEAALARGHKEEAQRAFEEAVHCIETLRAAIRPGEARAAFLADKLSPYERLVAIHLESEDQAGLRNAFRYVELARSRALVDQMSELVLRGKRGAGKHSDLRQRFLERREELAWFTARAEEDDGREDRRSDRRRQASLEVASRERRVVSLFRRLQAEDDELASALSPEPVSLRQARRELHAGEAMVEYFMLGDEISAFVVTPDRARAYRRIASASGIHRRLLGLRHQLDKFGLGSSYFERHRDVLQRSIDDHLEALYEALFAPFAELAGCRLIVVPHGSLHYVPMHALKQPGGPYLIQSSEVSYAPSATLLAACRRLRRPPVYERDLLAIGTSDARTPHIGGEIAAVFAQFPRGVALTGDAATREAFLAQAARTRYIHVAAHGYYRGDNPLLSSVRLHDAHVRFFDIFDLRLDAELVVLSACHTGVADRSPGEELTGLARGFLWAGVPSVVVSLWAVSDESTAATMKTFYRRLAEGATSREALRAAQLEALDRYVHPYFWAPFVLIGRPD